MTPPSFRDSDEFKRGQRGERLVAEIYKREGWHIIASYDFAGSDGEKAPRMIGERYSYVLPDLDASKGGVRLWVEVKTKKEPTFTYMTQRYEHGIPWRHFEDYKHVAAESGCEVWLAIYEEVSGDVLVQALKKLETLVRWNDSPRMGKMAFFPRDAFDLW